MNPLASISFPTGLPAVSTSSPRQEPTALYGFKDLEGDKAKLTGKSEIPAFPHAINEPTSWGHMAHQIIEQVQSSQATAGEKVRDVLNGGKTPLHEAVMAVEESNISFQIMAEMRNKVIESYQEIMRMQI